MPNNHERVFPAPEPLQTPERLLDESTTAAQALMLLGLDYPKDKDTPPTLRREKIEQYAKNKLDPDHSKRITNGSFNERDDYWKGRSDISEDKRVEEWKKSMNIFLDRYKSDTTKTTEQTFLKNIFEKNNLHEINASTFYDIFMLGDGKGDVEFFARRIVDTNSTEAIEKNEDFIKRLGKSYGSNSAKIAELLTYGIANAKTNANRFVKSAQENLAKGNYGEREVWDHLEQNSTEWNQKQHPQPDKEQETSLITEGAGETIQSTQHENQDRFFVDDKNKAYGVFDGVTGSGAGAQAASLAEEVILEELAKMPVGIDFDASKEFVLETIKKANTHIQTTSGRTTASVVKIWQDKAIIVNVGDSRVYIQSNDKLRQVTEDDDLIKYIRDYAVDPQKAIEIKDKINNCTTRDEFYQLYQMQGLELKDTIKDDWEKLGLEDHLGFLAPYTHFSTPPPGKHTQVGNMYISQDKDWFDSEGKHRKDGKVIIPVEEIFGNLNIVFKSLGRPAIETNLYVENIEKGDRIVLMSDGVYESLAESEMEKIIHDNPRPKDAAKKLIDESQRFLKNPPSGRTRRKDDDQTAVVVEIK